MPIYTYQNNKTNKQWTESKSIADHEQYLKNNKDVVQVFTKMNIVRGVVGTSIKSSEGMNETLQRVAEAHPNSPLADRYKTKSIKETKTQAAVEKWRKARDKNK